MLQADATSLQAIGFSSEASNLPVLSRQNIHATKCTGVLGQGLCEQTFHAHKIALTASSAAFSAMFESGCREASGGIPSITIPNISLATFQAMITFLYTGDLQECSGNALMPGLLEVSDQYLLESLTNACATKIASRLEVSTVLDQYELAMRYNAKKLAHATVVFMVQHHADMEAKVIDGREGFARTLVHVRPVLNEYLQACLWSDQSPREGDAAVAGGRSRSGSP
jgi:hypothetical protein